MDMTDEEIRRRYKNMIKRGAIKALAELNDCAEVLIRDIIYNRRQILKGKTKNKVRTLHEAGYTDREIAVKLGMSVGAVFQSRSRQGLKPNKRRVV
jgi:hypothetical protein